MQHAGCDDCGTTETPTQTPTETPTTAPTAVPTEVPTVAPTATPTGTCKDYCSTNTNSWDTKCTWNNCEGCDDCGTVLNTQLKTSAQEVLKAIMADIPDTSA